MHVYTCMCVYMCVCVYMYVCVYIDTHVYKISSYLSRRLYLTCLFLSIRLRSYQNNTNINIK